MGQEVLHHTFPNGLTLLVEQMGQVHSAALNFLIPAGNAYDPPDRLGLSAMLADLITRGAGARDTRQLTLALDGLGLDRSESVGALHMRFWGATLARNLSAALELYADILRRPHLPDAELPAVKALALQDIQSLEDEPRQKVLVELRKRHFTPPLGQDKRGNPESVEATTIDDLRRHYHRLFQSRGAILGVAGRVEWRPLLEQVDRLFGDWPSSGEPVFDRQPALPRSEHLTKQTQQTQIGLAFASVPIGQPDYYSALGAVNVLSGGMSSRLFTEVREKRGLCYAIWATYQTFRDEAAILCYAGTTNDRAQQTLDVTLRELERLQKGVTRDEVERVQAGLKASLIMQEESTSARAGAIASDWYYLGRVRSLDEIQQAIDALTPATIVDYIRRYPPGDYTIVTLGPKPLTVGRPSRNGKLARRTKRTAKAR